MIDIATYDSFREMRTGKKLILHVFLLKKQLVDKLVAEAMIDGKRDIQMKFRARIMDLAVHKLLLEG